MHMDCCMDVHVPAFPGKGIILAVMRENCRVMLTAFPWTCICNMCMADWV